MSLDGWRNEYICGVENVNKISSDRNVINSHLCVVISTPSAIQPPIIIYTRAPALALGAHRRRSTFTRNGESIVQIDELKLACTGYV